MLNCNNSLILGEPNSGKTLSIIITILQKLINNLPYNAKVSKKESEDLFLNTEKIFEENKKNLTKNKEKRLISPRGVLVISPRFEFTTKLYSMFRKLDYSNKLRMTRLGSSLQSICPIVEHIENNDFSDSDYDQISKMNLTNNTNWANTDILFSTPMMYDYISVLKDRFDYFDINPEIIVIDDFDYLFG